MTNNQYLNKEWYTFLKKKYKLSDDDMEEFIDSFELINKGDIITPNILLNFLNEEMDEKDQWTFRECENIISKINEKVNEKNNKRSLDLRSYLLYIIPICHYYVVTRIGIKELFDSLDTNQDGKITCKELINVLYKVNKNLTPSEISELKKQIKEICKKVDTNNDGFLSYDEFKTFMMQRNMLVHKKFD